MTYHVIPMGELDKHKDSAQCHCNPYMEEYNGDLIIVHWPISTHKERAKKTKENTKDEFRIITN